MNRYKMVLFSITLIAIGLVYRVSASTADMNEHTPYAQDVLTLEEILLNSADYDMRVVTVIGEAVGDIMGRGQMFWVNIKDGNLFVGVILDREQAEKVEYLGRYGVRGDLLKITGPFYISSPAQYRDMAIEARSLHIEKRGGEFAEELSLWRFFLAFAIAILTLILAFSSRRIARLRGSADTPEVS